MAHWTGDVNMKRIVAVVCLFASLLAAQKTPAKKPVAGPPVLDRPRLEAYFRHLFVWPQPIQIAIADPTPAPMPGYWLIKVTGSQGQGSITENFFLSQDQKNIIRGQVFDANENPFKPELDKIRTEFQPATGTSGAPVVLVEFSDFECQYCREEAKVLRDNLLKEYPKDVRLYFMAFPLEQIHPWARAAASMGRCIFHQQAGAFWDYHDWIFEHQAEITPENLKSKVLEFAKTKGIDVDQLSKCVENKATDEEVNQTIAMGKALEVQSTPTIFINGRRLAGAMAWPDLKRVIDYEIDYQKVAKNAGENCGCDLRLPTVGFGQSGTMPAAPEPSGKGVKK